MGPGEVEEARDLALEQSIVTHKTSLLETLCCTMEKLLVTESEANPNHSFLFGRHCSGLRTSCRLSETVSILPELKQFQLCLDLALVLPVWFGCTDKMLRGIWSSGCT